MNRAGARRAYSKRLLQKPGSLRSGVYCASGRNDASDVPEKRRSNMGAATQRDQEVEVEGNHVHVFVRDLTGALAWFARVWTADPTYRDEGMAVLQFGPIVIVLDKGEEETVTTLGYSTEDCDADFRTVVGRGAEVIEVPANRSWGVRAAYLKGPGRVTLELEQELSPADAGGSDSGRERSETTPA
jgi:hypothetical protein